jgi:hypothetical protein
MVNEGEQVLLEYSIRVYAPQLAAVEGEGSADDALAEFLDGGAASYEMTTWALPTASWYLEQEELAAQGIDTGYGGYGGVGALGGLGGF